jgi:hypothetical protein
MRFLLAAGLLCSSVVLGACSTETTSGALDEDASSSSTSSGAGSADGGMCVAPNLAHSADVPFCKVPFCSARDVTYTIAPHEVFVDTNGIYVDANRGGAEIHVFVAVRQQCSVKHTVRPDDATSDIHWYQGNRDPFRVHDVPADTNLHVQGHRLTGTIDVTVSSVLSDISWDGDGHIDGCYDDGEDDQSDYVCTCALKPFAPFTVTLQLDVVPKTTSCP